MFSLLLCLGTQLCLTLCNPMDCSPQGSSVHGDSPGKNIVYWSGLPCPPPGALPYPGTEPRSPTLQAASLLSEPPRKPMFSLLLLNINLACRLLENNLIN